MEIIYLLIALAVCITVHEAAHAWVAFMLGDPTAKMEGRVSLNPLRHLDLFGTIMIFIAHFGWGKPVPFNYNNLKNPRRDAFLIAVAGPITNLLTAFLITILFKYVPLPGLIRELLRSIYALSIVLFLFNLVPIAPLDGSKFIGLIVPRSKEYWYQRFLAQGPIFLIVLIIADLLISEVTGFSFLGTYLQFGYDLITTVLMLGS